MTGLSCESCLFFLLTFLLLWQWLTIRTLKEADPVWHQGDAAV